jgi:hypothetical protein
MSLFNHAVPPSLHLTRTRVDVNAQLREPYLNALLQLVVDVELPIGKKSLQVQKQIKVCKGGDPAVPISIKQETGVFEPRRVGALCRGKTQLPH